MLIWTGASFEYERLPEEYQLAKTVTELSSGELVLITTDGKLSDPGDVTRYRLFDDSGLNAELTHLFEWIPGSDRIIVRSARGTFGVNDRTDGVEHASYTERAPADTEQDSLKRKVQVHTPRWRFAVIGAASAGALLLRNSSGNAFQISLGQAGVHLRPVAPHHCYPK